MGNSYWDELNKAMLERGIYHGIPHGIGLAPITTSSPDLQIIIDSLQGLRAADEEKDDLSCKTVVELAPENQDAVMKFHHSWISSRQWRGHFVQVAVYQSEITGKFVKLAIPISYAHERLNYFMETGGYRNSFCSVEAEQKARAKLESVLTDHQKNCYYLHDSFPERGRSGYLYILRKNRPTLVISDHDQSRDVKTLCALCLHPLAYYTDSWAGAMVPSDEVLAHLLMIRADEHFFWRKANQISLEKPQSGI